MCPAAQELVTMQQVLNLIMFRLRKRPYDEAQLAFLAVDEHLVDIGDDLCERLQLHCTLTMRMSHASACPCTAPRVAALCADDYEDDVLKNSFNVFRGLRTGQHPNLHVQGSDAGRTSLLCCTAICRQTWTRLPQLCRCFRSAYIRVFGRDAQMRLIARISTLERQHETLLAALPTAMQQQFRARHKQAAAEPGQNRNVISLEYTCHVAASTCVR
jgi:hypothetical protein